MKIVVINGTEKHGVTFKLKEMFLDTLRDDASITEYYLPKDCPSFCVGCTSCFAKGENTCKDYVYINAIEKSLLESDLIIMTSPAYVMHATGAMKSLLDHLGYRWMPHRPAVEMFSKRAVIITQCLGAGAKSTAKDIKDSLSWWGISQIKMFGCALMNDIVWDRLSVNKRKQLTAKVKRFAQNIAKINFKKPARTKFITKIKFNFCRMIQKRIRRCGVKSLDAHYWLENGWLNKKRPWKK